MANKVIELVSFSSPPHAKHILVKKSDGELQIHLLDKFYNNQGGIVLSEANAKLLVKELMDELYGEFEMPK